MANYKDLEKKIILVSGASGLLGSDFVKNFLLQKSIVIAIDKNLSKSLKEFQHKNLFFVKCDITRPNDVNNLVRKIFKKYKKIDVLINSAASKSKNLKDFFEKFETFKYKKWKEIMSVNIDGSYLLSQAVSKVMIKSKSGSIINIASIQGILGNDDRIYKGSKFKGVQMNSPAVYSTSKAALIGLSRYLATYLGKFNIRVNSISPGGIRSSQNLRFLKNYSSKVPMKRMGEQKEITSTVLYLASSESSYITGQNIVVDGGYSIW
jgi:NAD(P)-dependent dehydrogenase (short-subunit alcohol dehydrogenase family)|tara:strand:- start:746 stop:1537 length:792 start_codon:yes stop_codon:yes gene_type:complete